MNMSKCGKMEALIIAKLLESLKVKPSADQLKSKEEKSTLKKKAPQYQSTNDKSMSEGD